MSATAAEQQQHRTVFHEQGYDDGYQGRPARQHTKGYLRSYRQGIADWDRDMKLELREWRAKHGG